MKALKTCNNLKIKILVDMILNIIATSIPTVTLQLLILPSLSRYMNSNEYGLFVTILAILNIIPSTMGNVLNNIKLLHNKKDENGDFQILLMIFEVINFIIMLGVSYHYLGTNNIVNNILLIVIAVLWLLEEYTIVVFRLDIKYKKILYNNIILVVGYLVGYLLYRITNYWELIYIMGYGFSCIYINKNSDLLYYNMNQSKKFKDVVSDTNYLLLSTFLARSLSYADKIILYPLLGGTMVSVYFAATIFGKVVGLVVFPINSVVLTYLTKLENKPNKIFKRIYLYGILLCFIGYIVSIIMSRPVLTLLYPMFVEEAMKYIYITTGTVVVTVLTTIISPFVLKFFDMVWQVYINLITIIFYIVISLILLKMYGMMGFCIASLLAKIVKLVITTLIFLLGKEKQQNSKKGENI